MTDRYIVAQPTPATAATEVATDLANALSARSSFTTVSALEGISSHAAATDTDASLATVVEAVRRATADAVLIDSTNDDPLTTFDNFTWSLLVAASTNAKVILALDTEGIPAELITHEIEIAQARALALGSLISAVALPPAAAQDIAVDGIATIALPITSDSLAQLDKAAASSSVTPTAFQADLIDRARSEKKRIVLPEPDDDRVLRAGAEVLARGIADITFIGETEAVQARASELNLDLSQAQIVSVDDSTLAPAFAEEFARLRAKKGVTIEQAQKKMKDVSYFGTMMVHLGHADGMVSGAAHTTAHTIVPSFQIIKTAPGTSIVSSIFLMLMRDKVWAFGDCAVNPNPTSEQLADIAISSARTAQQFGIDPRVAMLSYSTGTSGAGVDVERVTEATRIAREKAPNLALEGPIQFDAAVDATVASKKAPNSSVAGKATVFIFPELDSGNIGYKTCQRTSGAVAVGPILQGLNKPVNDLSRGALVEDIVNTIALTAVQAQN